MSIDYSYVEIRTRCLSYEFADAGTVYEAAAPALDVEPEALDAEEGVTVVWEILWLHLQSAGCSPPALHGLAESPEG